MSLCGALMKESGNGYRLQRDYGSCRAVKASRAPVQASVKSLPRKGNCLGESNAHGAGNYM